MMETPRSQSGVEGDHALVGNGRGPPPPLGQEVEGDNSLEPHWNVIPVGDSS